jgi:hypothetical protein
MALTRSVVMPRRVLPFVVILFTSMLGACGTASQPGAYGTLTWAGAPIGPPPTPNPARKRAIIASADGEWRFFGRQTVVFRGRDESIPHVGDWEDDDPRHSQRVNAYWSAAGHPEIDGMDCTKPWSAVFITWVMRRAGVPESQLQPAIAHWEYLAQSIQDAGLPGRWFVPRRVADYSPRPGDLICSTLGKRRARTIDGYISAEGLRGTSTHCDLVVAKRGRELEAIGGNVRNSVSKVSLELDGKGRLKRVPRRPWFMILQNRL